MKRLLSENLFEKYKIDDFKSFFRRKNESMKFSQLSNAQSQIVYMLLDHELKDLLASFITSRKSNSKELNNIIDEDIIDENIIDKDIITSKNITDKDIIDKDITKNKNVIDKDIVTSKNVIDENIIDKNVTTSKDVIEKVIIKEIDAKRSKRDQMNDCDCREFDKF